MIALALAAYARTHARPAAAEPALPYLGIAGEVDLVWTSADRRIQLYCGDALAALDRLDDAAAGLVLTDPPFSERTHRGARTRKRQGKKQQRAATMITFAAAGDGFIRSLLEECARVSSAWTLAFLDRHPVGLCELEPIACARLVRVGSWIKSNGAPQFTGDRPAEGQDRIGIFHRDGLRLGRRADGTPMRWNGKGAQAVWTYPTARGEGFEGGPETVKPLALVRELIRLFSDPDDLVIDPCAGSGTTLEAAHLEGRRAIGIELSPAYARGIAGRLTRATAQQDLFPVRSAR